jgi:hypothetical protein
MPERPSNWKTIRKRVLQRDNHECKNCGVKGGSKGRADLEVHHIVPLESGGSNKKSNLKTLCSECHAAVHYEKTARTDRSISLNPTISSSSATSTTSNLPFLKILAAPFVFVIYILGIVASILSVMLSIQAYIFAIMGFFLLAPVWIAGKGLKKLGVKTVNATVGYDTPSYEEKTVYVGHMRPLTFFVGIYIVTIYLNSIFLILLGLILSWIGISASVYFDTRFLQSQDANFKPTRAWAGISFLTFGIFGVLYGLRRMLYTKIRPNIPSPK